jgi:hypothetical protein
MPLIDRDEAVLGSLGTGTPRAHQTRVRAVAFEAASPRLAAAPGFSL